MTQAHCACDSLSTHTLTLKHPHIGHDVPRHSYTKLPLNADRFLPRDATLARYGRVSLCLYVTSRCSTETAKRRITQTRPHDRLLTPKISAKIQTGSTHTEAPKCRWGIGHFQQITRYNSKTSTVAIVVNLVRSQVYPSKIHLCLQHVCRDAARCMGSSATADTFYNCASARHSTDYWYSKSLSPSVCPTATRLLLYDKTSLPMQYTGILHSPADSSRELYRRRLRRQRCFILYYYYYYYYGMYIIY